MNDQSNGAKVEKCPRCNGNKFNTHPDYPFNVPKRMAQYDERRRFALHAVAQAAITAKEGNPQ